MPPSIRIVGLGLAGVLLGWELERNGAEFEIFAPPVDDENNSRFPAASAVAAGIVNPITGQRIVKSWRVDHLLPLARETYQALERAWSISVWRDLRIRRLWRSDAERKIFAAKRTRGELAPYLGEADGQGFWITGAGHVDVPRLLATARTRWRSSGRLTEQTVASETPGAVGQLVIWCTGTALRNVPGAAAVPWFVSTGETLDMATRGLDPDVMVSCGHWLLPGNADEAKVGATYVPGLEDGRPTAAGRAELEQSAELLLGQRCEVRRHLAGVRLTVQDKHPVIGRLPGRLDQGIIGGLGSKGVLLAPWLGRQWWNHLSEGVAFEPSVDISRYLIRA